MLASIIFAGILAGCQGGDGSSNNPDESSYSVSASSEPTTAIGKTHEIKVTVHSENKILRVKGEDQLAISNVRLHFLDQDINNDFTANYSDSCQTLFDTASCIIKLVPHQNEMEILNRDIYYTISYTVNGAQKTLAKSSFKVESLSFPDPLVVSAGDSKVFSLKNDTKSNFYLKSDEFSIEGAQASQIQLSNNTCVGELAAGVSCSFTLNADSQLSSNEQKLVIKESNGVSILSGDISVIRPEITIENKLGLIKPHTEMNHLRIVNNTDADIIGLHVKTPDLTDVIVRNGCTDTRLEKHASCEIQFIGGAEPEGKGSIIISANNADSRSVDVNTYTPSFSVSLPKTQTTLSAKEEDSFIIYVENNYLQEEIKNLQLKGLNQFPEFSLSEKESTCLSHSVLKAKEQCVYVVKYNASSPSQVKNYTVNLSVSADNMKTEKAAFQLKVYPKFYAVPYDLLSYKLLPSLAVNSIVTNGSDLYVATDNGIASSEDSGQTWHNYRDLDVNQERFSAIAVQDGTIYAANEATLYVSKDNGQSWVKKTYQQISGKILPKNLSLYRIISTPRRVYVIYMSEVSVEVYQSIDGGDNWSPAPDALNNVISITQDKVSGKLYAISPLNGVSVSEDGGNTWKSKTNIQTETGEKGALSYYQYGENAYIVPFNNQFEPTGLYISHDGGKTWAKNEAIESLLVEDAPTFIYGDQNEIYVTDSNGEKLLVSKDAGKSWQVIGAQTDFPDEVNVNGIVHQADKTYVATDKGLYLSEDQGAAWHIVGGDADTIMTDHDKVVDDYDGVLYSTTDYGVIVKASYDQGETWNVLVRGRDLPPEVLDIHHSGLASKAYVHEGKIYIWNPEHQKNWVYISKDQGQHWEKSILPSSGNDVSVKDSMYTHGENIYFATVFGIYLSHDGGVSWQYEDIKTFFQADNVYAINAVSGFGDNVYVMGRGTYRVFMARISHDNGMSWESSNFNIPTGEDSPIMGLSTWQDKVCFISIEPTIYCSDDKGKNWKAIKHFADKNKYIFSNMYMYDNNLYLYTGSNELQILKEDGKLLSYSEQDGIKGVRIENVFAAEKYLYVSSSSGIYRANLLSVLS